MSRKSRAGFTIVELLVVISIIGTLVSLLVPAVVASRERAYRLQCLHQQGQLALALQSFQTARNYFPGYDNELPAGTRTRRASWVVQIMSHFDQQPIYDRWVDGTISDADVPRPFAKVYVCPSRSSWNTALPQCSYVVNGGFWVGDFGPWTFPSPYNDANAPVAGTTAWWHSLRPANGIFVDRWTNPQQRIDITRLIDGASNTLMLAENIQTQDWDYVTNLPDVRPNPDFDARIGTTFMWLYTLDSSTSPKDPNKPDPNFFIDQDPVYHEAKINGSDDLAPADRASLARPSSFHQGVSIVAFADGHTQALAKETEYHVYQQLCTAHGSRSDAPYASYILQGQN